MKYNDQSKEIRNLFHGKNISLKEHCLMKNDYEILTW